LGGVRPEGAMVIRDDNPHPTGEILFSLTYGTEAVISAEVGSPSFKVSHYNPGLNDEGIKLHLDLLQKRRNEAHVTWAAYQNRIASYFNKTVNPRKFKVEDWVLRKMCLTTKDPIKGKPAPKWEDPYQVVKCHEKGAYHLVSTESKRLSRAWNAEHLEKNTICDIHVVEDCLIQNDFINSIN